MFLKRLIRAFETFSSAAAVAELGEMEMAAEFIKEYYIEESKVQEDYSGTYISEGQFSEAV